MCGKEFVRIVDDLSTPPKESELSGLVCYAVRHELSDHDIAYLAKRLADSGARLKHSSRNGLDIASTGGPSSLSTLLTPLFLRLMNRVVPKLGIPGRPAGGIDVLATIPHYRIHLQPSEVVGCLERCGYVHFVAGEEYAPLDARIFSVRQQLGAQASVPLVIASLLAKKLVVGLEEMGLDIRVGPDNNFGISFNQARLNARRFCSVARTLGTTAKCILTDGSRPYQPMLGRGESLVALQQLFEERAGPWLQCHMAQCWNMAVELTGNSEDCPPSGPEMEHVFASNLCAQGSSLDAFQSRVLEVIGQPRFPLLAKSSGWVLIKLGAVRTVLVEIQQKYSDLEDGFPDPVGVEFLVNTGGYVKSNEDIAIVRAPESLHAELEQRLSLAMEIVDHSTPASQEDSWEVIADGE